MSKKKLTGIIGASIAVVIAVMVIMAIPPDAEIGTNTQMPTNSQTARVISNVQDAHWPHAFYMNMRPVAIHFQGTNRNRAYIVFQDYAPDGTYTEGGVAGCDPYICYYDYDTETFHGPWKIGDTPVPADHHSAAAIFVDGYDKLHVFYGSHNSDQLWTRSTRSLDVETPFTGSGDFETPKQLSGQYTYPNPIVDNNGTLWLFVRIGEVPPGGSRRLSWQYQISTSYDGAWNDASFGSLVKLTESLGPVWQGYYKGYPQAILDNDGNIILTLANWQDETNDLAFCRYNFAEARWERANGTPYDTIPIPRADAEFIATNCGGGRPAVDSDGNMYVLYRDRADGSRYLVKFTTSWQSPVKISDYDLFWAQGRFLDVRSPRLVDVYLCEGKELRVYHSEDGGTTFGSKPTILYKHHSELGSLAPIEGTRRGWVVVGKLGGTWTPDGDAYGEIICNPGEA